MSVPDNVAPVDQARAELVALDTYRIDHDLTWRELAGQFKAAGCPIPARTLHYLCKRAHNAAYVYDRTIAKVRTFLAKKKITATPSARTVIPGTIRMRTRSRVSA